jgi:hypothetical protein
VTLHLDAVFETAIIVVLLDWGRLLSFFSWPVVIYMNDVAAEADRFGGAAFERVNPPHDEWVRERRVERLQECSRAVCLVLQDQHSSPHSRMIYE